MIRIKDTFVNVDKVKHMDFLELDGGYYAWQIDFKDSSVLSMTATEKEHRIVLQQLGWDDVQEEGEDQAGGINFIGE